MSWISGPCFDPAAAQDRAAAAEAFMDWVTDLPEADPDGQPDAGASQ